MENQTVDSVAQAERSWKRFWPLIAVCAVVIAVPALLWSFGPKGSVVEDGLREMSAMVPPTPTAPAFTAAVDGQCGEPVFKDVGSIATDHDVLVYSTTCVLKQYSNNSTDSVFRLYVRDAEGTFNRKIFETVNYASFHGLTYAEVQGQNIRVHRVKSGSDEVVIDVFGQVVAGDNFLAQESGLGTTLESPNGELIALSYFSDGEKGEVIDVLTLADGSKRVFTFPGVGLNGVYPVAWSPDGKILYVAGGIWEFGAPAKLWSIDVETGVKKEFGGLEDFSYPVTVFPEINKALVTKSDIDGVFSEGPSVHELYELNLTSGAVKKVITENVVAAFNTSLEIGGSIYYDVHLENNVDLVKRYDGQRDASEVLFEGDGVYLLHYLLDNEWLIVQQPEGAEFYSTKTGNRASLDLDQLGFPFLIGREGFDDLVGVIHTK